MNKYIKTIFIILTAFITLLFVYVVFETLQRLSSDLIGATPTMIMIDIVNLILPGGIVLILWITSVLLFNRFFQYKIFKIIVLLEILLTILYLLAVFLAVVNEYLGNHEALTLECTLYNALTNLCIIR